ncbi:MarR family winged helix-turn-helix transcriptional regulator [Levilactobacillus acidifarinae]|uniref:Transcriptional regulator n=1 Tax=Levilactobacillus acidifarinae DSM 19394 = JCM 15949 TaxID=1423715 RepID=A0A0R1LUQ6_9LACO|nr:MarR family transcriptional regulator [Levilactobacillus acidifarinae]KRK96138.1 transcriptional regulator [Levilactobacillus acidifarinae DSM 19394]GEO69500.1 hypothetical protein LAC03_14100 [Levilactobacillus acidifarinae]
MDNDIFEALFEVLTFFHQPQDERQQLRQAGTALEPAAMPIIVRAGQQPGVSVGELAGWIGRNHSSISRQVDRLIKTGWLTEVERDDQRIRRIKLTEKGQRGLMQLKVARETEFSQRIQDYTPQQRADLLRTLRLLAKTLRRPKED